MNKILTKCLSVRKMQNNQNGRKSEIKCRPNKNKQNGCTLKMVRVFLDPQNELELRFMP